MSLDFDSARLPDPNLRAEHAEWRATLRRFLDTEVMPHVDAWDEAGEVPLTLWPKAAAIGLLGLGYPEAYRGSSEGIDIWYRNIVSEELARTSLAAFVQMEEERRAEESKSSLVLTPQEAAHEAQRMRR